MTRSNGDKRSLVNEEAIRNLKDSASKEFRAIGKLLEDVGSLNARMGKVEMDIWWVKWIFGGVGTVFVSALIWVVKVTVGN